MALLDELKEYFALKGQTLSKGEIVTLVGDLSSKPKPLTPTDPAPTTDGIYKPTVDGTYANAGNLKRETGKSEDDYGMAVEFIKNGIEWVKNSYPLPKADVVNNLSGGGEDKALSAQQGVELAKRALEPNSMVNGGVEFALPYEEGYLNQFGVFVPSASFRTTPMIPVYIEGQPFLYRGSATGGVRAMYAYDVNGVLISAVLEGINTQGGYVTAIPPSGTAFVRGSSVPSGNLSILGGVNIKSSKVQGLDELKKEVDNMASKMLQPYDFALNDLLSGYILLSGFFIESANWRSTDFIKAYAGTTIRYRGTGQGANIPVAGYDSSKRFVAAIIGGSPLVADGYAEAEVPEGVKYIRFSSQNVTGFSFISARVMSIAVGVDYNNLKKEVPHIWNAVGHSIWVANTLQNMIRENIIFAGYNNYGYDGKCLTQAPVGTSNSILYHSGEWVPAKIWSFDSITNDHKLNKPIGVEDDFLNNTGATTFYGALRVLHETIKTLQPNYTMVCASPLQKVNGAYTSFSANTLGHTLQDYTDALLFVANRLSWKFVDQFKNSGLNMDNILLYTTDGLHPNLAGYEQYKGLWINEFYKL